MAKHYAFKPWDVERLTFAQLEGYMQNLRYVLEMSKDLGKPPDALPPVHDLVDMALYCGIQVPFNVRYEMVGLDVFDNQIDEIALKRD